MKSSLPKGSGAVNYARCLMDRTLDALQFDCYSTLFGNPIRNIIDIFDSLKLLQLGISRQWYRVKVLDARIKFHTNLSK